MKTETPTPRTDIFEIRLRATSNILDSTAGAPAILEHARQLERELTAEKLRADRAEEHKGSDKLLIISLQANLAVLQKVARELVESATDLQYSTPRMTDAKIAYTTLPPEVRGAELANCMVTEETLKNKKLS